jgi:hypothetical protein
MQERLKALDIGEELFWEPLRLVPPDPWVGHLPFAYWLIKVGKPAMLLELGTHTGNSYFAFCQALASLNTAARAYAVDTWQGDEHAGYYSDDVFADVTAFNRAHFLPFSTLVRTTFDDARGYFPDSSIDLLHIDGMHTYEAVKHDFETWRSALSQRAVVVFHDVNVRERGFGVWRLWRELSGKHPSFEFAHSNGLGVLGIGQDQPEPLRQLFELASDRETAAAIRLRFSTRGEVFQRRMLQAAELGRIIAAREQRIAELNAVRVQTQARLTETATALAASEAARVKTAAMLAGATAVRTRAETALADTETKLHEAVADTEHRNAMIQELQAHGSALEQTVTVLSEDNRRLLGAAALYLEQLRAIEQSTTWRATAGLRAAAARLPKPIQRSLRWTARALYWVLTPYRIPARIRLTRERRS